jgi:hypothetical protein
VAEFLAINDFAVHWGTRRQQSCVTAGRVAWWGDLRAVDLTAYARWASAAGIDWRAGGWQSQLLLYAGGGSKAPAPPATAASDALAVDGLSVAGSGRPLFAAKRVDAMLDVSDFGKPYPSGRLSYRHDGGSWHRSPAVQDRTQVSLDVQSLPVGDLVDAIAAAVERVSAEPASARQVPDGAGTLMDDVFAALGRAGTRLSDVQAAVAGEGWEATLSGEARPGGDSMAMTADVAVHGLDAWLRDAGPVLGRAAVQTLRSAARSDSDGDKGPASRFRLTLPPGDRPMVNGYPLTMDEW